MKEDLIRDRLVVGIRDHSLSEQLQMEPDLTLDKVKRLIHQRDTVKEQQETLKAPIKEESTLDAVSKRTPRRILPPIPSAPPPSTPLRSCRRCGKGSHPRQSCPARDVTCFRCNRKGHYSTQYQSSTVVELTTEKNQTEVLYAETAYLNTIEGTDKNIWEIKIGIEGKYVPFKVDTGAEVTVLSEVTWKSLKLSSPLKKTGTLLCGPDQSCLKVLGETTITQSYQRRSSTQRVFVVNNLKNNLLGLPAIKALQLLSNVCSIDNSIISQYPSLFTGLGKFGQ